MSEHDFSKRPGHLANIPTVKREQWGDTAGVGPYVEGVVSALGEAIIDQAIGGIPGRGVGARLLRSTLRKSYYRGSGRSFRGGYTRKRYARVPFVRSYKPRYKSFKKFGKYKRYRKKFRKY